VNRRTRNHTVIGQDVSDELFENMTACFHGYDAVSTLSCISRDLRKGILVCDFEDFYFRPCQIVCVREEIQERINARIIRSRNPANKY
jgi:hypothetical protein